MEETSHKSEMAAALRGDFERLRARRHAEKMPPALTEEAIEHTPAGAVPVPEADNAALRRLFLARILDR